ncbi:hypothetical protein BKI52_34230 [marine bacterium AO1-C]|nr:hypothetical protein BKI52_34230 [marine bacterium AO1-C]
MNLKRNIVLMAALALIVVGSTAMISRHTENTPTKKDRVVEDKVVPEKKTRWGNKGHKLVWATLTKPLAKKYKVNLKRQMISRCPSGLQYRLAEYAVKKGNYFYGKMYKYSGCAKGAFICKFRVNTAQNQVQVFDQKTKKYTSHNQWLVAHAGPQKIQQAKRY